MRKYTILVLVTAIVGLLFSYVLLDTPSIQAHPEPPKTFQQTKQCLQDAPTALQMILCFDFPITSNSVQETIQQYHNLSPKQTNEIAYLNVDFSVPESPGGCSSQHVSFFKTLTAFIFKKQILYLNDKGLYHGRNTFVESWTNYQVDLFPVAGIYNVRLVARFYQLLGFKVIYGEVPANQSFTTYTIYPWLPDEDYRFPMMKITMLSVLFFDDRILELALFIVNQLGRMKFTAIHLRWEYDGCVAYGLHEEFYDFYFKEHKFDVLYAASGLFVRKKEWMEGEVEYNTYMKNKFIRQYGGSFNTLVTKEDLLPPHLYQKLTEIPIEAQGYIDLLVVFYAERFISFHSDWSRTVEYYRNFFGLKCDSECYFDSYVSLHMVHPEQRVYMHYYNNDSTTCVKNSNSDCDQYLTPPPSTST